MVTLSLRVLSHSTAIERLLDIPTTRGRVDSVFPRAANIVLGGRLLTLHAYETPCAPNGMVLALRAGQKPLGDLQPELAVIVERGTISIPALSLRLNLQQSQPWNPHPNLAPDSCPPKRLQRHLATLVALLAANAPADGLAPLATPHGMTRPRGTTGPPLLRTAWPAIQGLLEGVARRQMAQARQSAGTLIGLGPGLTPSGDDVLIGFIAATILLSEPVGQSAEFFQRLSAELLMIARSQTNKLSVTWIEYAGHGQVAEHLSRLFAALVLDDPHTLEQAALEVLNTGATSGGDMLTGVILGGRCLIEQEHNK